MKKENKKSLVMGIAAAAFLTVSVGTNVVTSKMIIDNQNATTQKTVQAVMYSSNKSTAQIAQMKNEQQAKALQAISEQTMSTSAKVTPDGNIHEEFKIYEAKNNHIRGELINGTGEGIWYDVKYLKPYLKGKTLKTGDKIYIEWGMDAYFEENWNDIEKIGFIQ